MRACGRARWLEGGVRRIRALSITFDEALWGALGFRGLGVLRGLGVWGLGSV